jgi:transposase-like protein
VPRRYTAEFRRKVLDLVEAGRPVAQVAHDLDISAQCIYTWRKQQLIDRGQLPGMTSTDQAELSRRVHAELTLGLGITIGHGAIELLMRRAGIKGLPGSRRPRPKHQTPIAADLVHRQFSRAAPDQLWVTAITGHPTREGKDNRQRRHSALGMPTPIEYELRHRKIKPVA